MTFNDIVTFPIQFFISLMSTMSELSIFVMVIAALVVCSVVMLITKVWRI